MSPRRESEHTARASGNPPDAGRPRMPKDYGISEDADGQLPWSWAVERLSTARNYWIATTRPNGRPHVMPVWGLWMDDKFVFATDARSRKGRNLLQNPSIVVHLESGDEAVILEGIARKIEDSALLNRLHSAYQAKYGTGLLGIPGDVLVLSVRPELGFGWEESRFLQSATKWDFTKK